jgi:Baseplate J-like protein
MPLPSPNLDDRDFNQLAEEARRRVSQSCPDWTDLSPNDPGWALLELFAYLTETMIYRLNRLPEKAYIEFLRLIGVTLYPPTAAQARLRFSLNQPQTQPIEIPNGTRVTMNRVSGTTEAPIFTTARTVTLAAGQTQVEVMAYHCEWITAELAGTATGLPGFAVTAQRPPLIAPTGDGLDLMVGVESMSGELSAEVQAVRYQGKTFRVWREVETFVNLGSDLLVYRVDRLTGMITFAPAVQLAGADGQLGAATPLAAMPAANREIRLWYRRGGGSEGNVAANTLTVLKDPIPSVQVTNPDAATGGRGAESLQNALIRGPLELHALERAVTASDFELLAQRSGAVSRARAFTKARLWKYATPGTVEVLLVPQLSDELQLSRQVSITQLEAQQTAEAKTQIQQVLDERRPLGTTCLVNWVRYKTVMIQAKIVVHRGEDPEAVKERVLQRLYQTINPLVWPFGQPLRVDRVYEILLAESGVSYAEQVRFRVDDVPNQQVNALTADPSQPQTWYVGAADRLFRSLNGGDGWEAVWQFPQETVRVVQANADAPGLLAAVTDLSGDAQGSKVYFSFDCGETWQESLQFGFPVHQVAWILRAGTPILLMATGKGLFALPTKSGANPVQIQVTADPDLGFFAVVVATDARGTVNVVVAAEETRGIFLSSQEGKSGTFQSIDLEGKDVRVLAIQQDGPRTFLWAGVTVAGNEPGQGGFRWELSGSAEGWRQFQQGWTGGSVMAIAIQGSQVIAASYSSGILLLDSSRSDAAWQAPTINCGLPTRSTERFFYPILAVDVWRTAEGEMTVMAGGAEGVYRSQDSGTSYQPVSQPDFSEKVMLPPTWLFCSGEHQVEVMDQ